MKGMQTSSHCSGGLEEEELWGQRRHPFLPQYGREDVGFSECQALLRRKEKGEGLCTPGLHACQGQVLRSGAEG